MLEEEFAFFEENKASLLEKYSGKFIVIVGNDVVGAYDTQADAYSGAIKDHPPGSFFIQHALPDSEQQIHRFASLVYV